MLLRLRFGLVETRGGTTPQELLVEDSQLVAFRGSAATPEWLPTAEAETLVMAGPDANIPSDVARTHLDRVIGDLDPIDQELMRIANERAVEIRDAHRRVRKAARLSVGRLQVEPKLPVDVLGLYLYLPA